MYQSHFGLRKRPFRAIPDVDSYYPATDYERALSTLLQAIQDDEGFVLLTGDPGTGKTLLGHCLLDRLGEEVASAFVLQGHFRDQAGLLRALLVDFSLSHEGKIEQDLRLTLTDFLLENYGAGRRTVVVLDEAQHLRPDLLEELRLLGNLEGSGGKAFQVVLLALPPFAELLRLPELAAFQQRVAVHVRLEPLGLHEAADYVVAQLRGAGAKPQEVVTDEALEILVRGSGGVPRLLNRAMHRALQLAFAAGERRLDAEAALEALSALGLGGDDSEPSATLHRSITDRQAEESLAPEDAATAPSVLILDEEQEGEDLPEPGGPKNPGQGHQVFTSPRRPA